MQFPQRILIYCPDQSLLTVHRLIVEQQGFGVDAVDNLQDFKTLSQYSHRNYRLLIVCYTVLAEQQEAFKQLADDAKIPIRFMTPEELSKDTFKNVPKLVIHSLRQR